MILVLTRHGGGFFPDDAHGIEAVRSIKDGTSVRCEIKRVRSPKQLRLWWALMSKVADNIERYTSRQISDNVVCHLGFCDEFTNKQGVLVQRPHSISLGNMKAERFNELMTGAIDFIVKEILPVSPEDLRKELEEMI